MSAKGLHFVLNIISTLAIIHYLDPGAYGQYVLVLTSTMLVGLLADFGLTKLATREVARDFDSESQVLGTVLAARIVLAFVAPGRRAGRCCWRWAPRPRRTRPPPSPR